MKVLVIIVSLFSLACGRVHSVQLLDNLESTDGGVSDSFSPDTSVDSSIDQGEDISFLNDAGVCTDPDDTCCLQERLNALPSRGGEVSIGEETCILKRPLIMKSAQSLVGKSINSSWIQFDYFSDPPEDSVSIIKGNDQAVHRAKVENLWIYARSNTTELIAINMSGWHRGLVQDVSVGTKTPIWDGVTIGIKLARKTPTSGDLGSAHNQFNRVDIGCRSINENRIPGTVGILIDGSNANQFIGGRAGGCDRGLKLLAGNQNVVMGTAFETTCVPMETNGPLAMNNLFLATRGESISQGIIAGGRWNTWLEFTLSSFTYWDFANNVPTNGCTNTIGGTHWHSLPGMVGSHAVFWGRIYGEEPVPYP